MSAVGRPGAGRDAPEALALYRGLVEASSDLIWTCDLEGRFTFTNRAATAMLGRSLPYPASLEAVESTTSGMHVRWADDSGAGPDPAILYMLRWETLDSNRDMPRSPIPAPTRLRLYAFKK